MTLTGNASDSTQSDGFGNYTFSSLAVGGSYTVTPSKTALPPASVGIDTFDAIAVQQHYLTTAPLPPGCAQDAANVNGDNRIDTFDVLAIQRFYVGRTFGTANVGKYKFTPVNRMYTSIVTDQTGQNYDMLVFGDVVGSFVHRPEGALRSAAGDSSRVGLAAAIALPQAASDRAQGNFTAAVKTSTIDAKSKLVGFQGDFTFDERVVAFESEPVQKAGLTGDNWNVLGNVLPGTGPIRTLRISGYSTNFTPLSGSGTLFELRMSKVSQTAQRTQLIWAAPANQFIFIDADLNAQRPGNTAPGSINPSISSVGRGR